MRFRENDIVTIKARVKYVPRGGNDVEMIHLAPLGAPGHTMYLSPEHLEPFELHFEHGDMVGLGEANWPHATVMGVSDGMVWVKKEDGTFDSWLQRQCNRVDAPLTAEAKAA